MQTYVKDPNAVLDYVVDWEAWLDGDTLDTVTWIVDDGLTVLEESSTNTDTTATVWLSGGEHGATYRVTCRVTTAGGRQNDKSFMVRGWEQ